MKKVLIIDDDSMARDIYRAILEPAGFEVHDTGEGEAALELFKAHAFDCVILDIFMPGLSGLDLIQELDPETSGVPIIAISGAPEDTGTSALHLAVTLGAAKSFSKDFEHEELLEAVRELTGAAAG